MNDILWVIAKILIILCNIQMHHLTANQKVGHERELYRLEEFLNDLVKK